MNEYEITSTKTEYTGKGYKTTITFRCGGETFTVTGFSDMMSLAQRYAMDAMDEIVMEQEV